MSSEFTYCIECGTRLPATAKFCNVCGTRIATSDAGEATSVAPPSTSETATEEQPTAADDQGAAAAPDETLVAEPDAQADQVPAESETLVTSSLQEAPPTPAAGRPDPFATQIADIKAAPPAPPEPKPAEPVPPAAVWPSQESAASETTEVRHYPPTQEIKREDLPPPLPTEHAAASTREVELPEYHEAAGGFSLRPGMIMAALGFVVALVGVFLPWVSALDEEIAPLDDEFLTENFQYFQIADALDSEEILDGYIVIGIAGVGLLFLLLEYFVLRRLAIGRVVAALGGLALGALGVVELLWIRDAFEEVSYDYEPGVFLVIIGGATAIVGSLIPVGFSDDTA
jgi:zinc-ribbon domain